MTSARSKFVQQILWNLVEYAARILVPFVSRSPRSPRAVLLSSGGHFEVVRLITSRCIYWRSPQPSIVLAERTSSIARMLITDVVPHNSHDGIRDQTEIYDPRDNRNYETTKLG